MGKKHRLLICFTESFSIMISLLPNEEVKIRKRKGQIIQEYVNKMFYYGVLLLWPFAFIHAMHKYKKSLASSLPNSIRNPSTVVQKSVEKVEVTPATNTDTAAKCPIVTMHPDC